MQKAYGGRSLFPVVKADAYGHGAPEICRLLEAEFNDKELPLFCVARVTEARRLRREGVKRPILVLSQFSAEELAEDFPADTELVISGFADLASLAGLKSDVRSRVSGVHIEFDTGMNRLGFPLRDHAVDPRAQLGIFEEVRRLGLNVTGLMTHLARGEDNPSLASQEQAARFETFVRRLHVSWSDRAHGTYPRWVHLANSPGIARDLGASFANAARPGIHLWGLWATEEDRTRSRSLAVSAALKPVMRVSAPLRQLFWVMRGEGVGYGHRFKAPEDMLLNTVNLGYADGVSRSLSRTHDADWKVGFVVDGTRVPVAGTVSMDLCMMDLSKHPKAEAWGRAVSAGNPPELVADWIGPGQTAEDIAGVLGTISYEVVCAATARLRRRVG